MSLKDAIVKVSTRIVRSLPPRPSIAALASAYLDSYNGDNNMDAESNGEFSVACDLAPQSNVIFDIGANIGDWSCQVAGANSFAKVHAFEPSKLTFAMLQKNTAHLGDQIILNQYGLGSESSEKTLIRYPSVSELGSLYEFDSIALDSLGAPLREVVQLKSLDDYCSDCGISKVDFAKIDVEGHEVNVLRGAKRMMQSAAIRCIQFEYHATWIYSESHLRDVFHLMKNTPYQLFKLLGERKFLRIPRYSQSIDTHQYSNYLMVAEGVDIPGEIVERDFYV